MVTLERPQDASRGDLLSLWETCDDPATLLRLHQSTSDTVGLVRAVCACARLAIEQATPPDPRAVRALELAEAWTRGAATKEELQAAADGAWLASGRTGPDDYRTMAGEPTAMAAWHAAVSCLEPQSAFGVVGPVISALTPPTPSSSHPLGSARELAQTHALRQAAQEPIRARLLALVRSCLPSPKVEQTR